MSCRRQIRRSGKKAIVLLSGGLDSATTLYYAKSKKYKTYCLIFNYGQKHKKEIECAKKISKLSGSECFVINFVLPWKGSSLIDSKRQIPLHNLNAIGKPGILPSTYVPARNTIFLSFALSLAEIKKAEAVFIGANALDFSGYPDCRQKYFTQWNKLIKSLEIRKIKVITPLINKTKKEIIKMCLRLGVPYKFTWSCYLGGKNPCGKCDSCKLRQKGFNEAGTADPAL